MVSILSLDCINRLGIRPECIKSVQRQLTVADNTPFDVMGIVDLDVKINGLSIPCSFYVARQLVDNCLLGMDFLKMTSAKIDFNEDVISFYDDMLTVPLLSAQQHQSLVRLVGKVRIPAMAQALIKVKAPP